jgi:hypothetical protein
MNEQPEVRNLCDDPRLVSLTDAMIQSCYRRMWTCQTMKTCRGMTSLTRTREILQSTSE